MRIGVVLSAGGLRGAAHVGVLRRLVAERIPGARLVTDPDCGHTVRTSMDGYDEVVEAFLAEGDSS